MAVAPYHLAPRRSFSCSGNQILQNVKSYFNLDNRGLGRDDLPMQKIGISWQFPGRQTVARPPRKRVDTTRRRRFRRMINRLIFITLYYNMVNLDVVFVCNDWFFCCKSMKKPFFRNKIPCKTLVVWKKYLNLQSVRSYPVVMTSAIYYWFSISYL